MLKGPPVAVGMSIDVASIDMVSEVNMVSVVETPMCQSCFVLLDGLAYSSYRVSNLTENIL